MGCGGFVCTKNALIALNALYIVVAVILIGVGGYAKGASIVTSLTVVGGIIAVGVFLLLVALIGLYGTVKHHQVNLFFYMIILFCVFLVQFFIAVACLGAVNEEHIKTLVQEGWHRSRNDTLWDAEKNFNCCGLSDSTTGINCNKLPCFNDGGCSPCLAIITKRSSDNLQLAGGIGLFFSFTEILGIWLTMRYRNLKDPRADPNLYF
uniref:Tetraspanin-31 n=1 Tax=Plectus sambesii TaxID=2011161 RepID=A0A914X2G5_9BILA